MWCMRRTNIYLGEQQSAAVEEVARARGVSRAELIRQLIDSGLSEPGSGDLDTDLEAIAESFGVLADSHDFPTRGPDERARHLDRVASKARHR
jgi:hypothetical protein